MTTSKIFAWLDDFINPIVVKEVRQSVNGKSLMGTTMLFLAVQFIMLCMFTMENQRVSGNGNELFIMILAMLTYACIFGVATATSMRFSKECMKGSVDLMYTTIISPYKVVSGKIFSAMVMVIYLFSLSIPFLCIAYFLRGISIAEVLYMIALIFILLVPTIALSVFLGSITLSIVIRGAIFIGLLWGVGIFFAGLHEIRDRSFIELNIYTLLFFFMFAALFTGAFFSMAVASISHSASNVLFPFRIYAFISWLTTLAVAGVYAFLNDLSDGARLAFIAWFFVFQILLTIICCTSSAERLDQTKRVLKNTPRRMIYRIAYFLFSTGNVNNTIFCFLLMGITALIGKYVIFTSDHQLNEFLTMLGICAYALFYAGLVTYIRNRMKRIFPSLNGFVYFIVVAVAFGLIPLLAAILIFLDINAIETKGAWLFILSPASMAYNDTYESGIIVAVSGFLVVTMLNIRYYKEYIIKSLSTEKESSN